MYYVFVLYFAKYSRYGYAVSEVHATLPLKPSPPAAHDSPQKTKVHTSYLLQYCYCCRLKKKNNTQVPTDPITKRGLQELAGLLDVLLLIRYILQRSKDPLCADESGQQPALFFFLLAAGRRVSCRRHRVHQATLSILRSAVWPVSREEFVRSSGFSLPISAYLCMRQVTAAPRGLSSLFLCSFRPLLFPHFLPPPAAFSTPKHSVPSY